MRQQHQTPFELIFHISIFVSSVSVGENVIVKSKLAERLIMRRFFKKK